MATVLKEEDLIASVADGFQLISYYHAADYIRRLAKAYERGDSPAAKEARAPIRVNSRMAARVTMRQAPRRQVTLLVVPGVRRRQCRLGHGRADPT